MILIVEDDHPIAELLTSIINDEEGYYAIHVARPTEALETLKNVRPDLIVLDVSLPGMSGIELYDRIQCDERLRGVPVVFETALARQYEREFRDRGVDAVLEKPFDLNDVVRCVRALAPLPRSSLN